MIPIEVAIQQCVSPEYQQEMKAIVEVESSGNPNAIAIIKGGKMLQQPASPEQALKTLDLLHVLGLPYSAGAAQINHKNFSPNGVDKNNAFDPCRSVERGEQILRECYTRASAVYSDYVMAKEASWSCYYSGNFKDGFEKKGHEYSYVEKVLRALGVVLPKHTVKVVNTRGGRPPVKERHDKPAGETPYGVSSNVFEN
jgi:type IV secretion system protein VirB1